jgi:hypothetical protein
MNEAKLWMLPGAEVLRPRHSWPHDDMCLLKAHMCLRHTFFLING